MYNQSYVLQGGESYFLVKALFPKMTMFLICTKNKSSGFDATKTHHSAYKYSGHINILMFFVSLLCNSQ